MLTICPGGLPSKQYAKLASSHQFTAGITRNPWLCHQPATAQPAAPVGVPLIHHGRPLRVQAEIWRERSPITTQVIHGRIVLVSERLETVIFQVEMTNVTQLETAFTAVRQQPERGWQIGEVLRENIRNAQRRCAGKISYEYRWYPSLQACTPNPATGQRSAA